MALPDKILVYRNPDISAKHGRDGGEWVVCEVENERGHPVYMSKVDITAATERAEKRSQFWKDNHTAAENEIDRLTVALREREAEMRKFFGLVATVRRTNTDEWMAGLVHDMNKMLEAFGDTDRVEYRKGDGVIVVASRSEGEGR